LTEQGIALKIENYPIAPTNKINISATDNSDPVNAKLTYLEYKIREFENKNFRTLWLELCNSAQRYLDVVKQMLRYDATLGARLFLRTDGIVAEFTGDALTVWKCQQVTETKIFQLPIHG